jgi:two-component system, LytTR family, response regulator
VKISCIVVDDEIPAIKQMEDYIERVPFLKHLGSFNNGIEPMSFLQSNNVDLIFLDIEMEGFSGLQLIKSLRNSPRIILTTAYDQYALKAYELNVSDYLLKPISFERFMQSIDKVFDYFAVSRQPDTVHPQYKRDYFFVKTECRMQRVDFDDILYVEGMKEYLMIHTRSDKIMTLQNFKSIEELLPHHNFVRVHKSYIVALNKIISVEKNRISIGNSLIPVSNTYKDAFQISLKN